MLTVEALETGHGRAPALFGVSLSVAVGQVVALLGRNGMGKTTTIAAITGLLPVWAGSVKFDGRSLAGLPSFRIGQMGLGLVPEGRQIFPTLSVEENLIATSRVRPGARWTLDAVFRLFPRLAERRRNAGSALSGGEQQMLAIGRALMTNPRLLILDEATEGLAPVIRAEIWSVLAGLKAEGQAILLVDKHLSAVLRLADQAVVLEKGRSVWSGPGAALAGNHAAQRRYLHI
jgi:branched-chain amino acid transport system ATP-binding protein